MCLFIYGPLSVGVDVISQLPRVKRGKRGAGSAREGLQSYLENWCFWYLGAGVSLDHVSLILRKQSPERCPGLISGSGQGPSGLGAGLFASLLLTTLPPAVLPGLRGPQSPEESAHYH